MNTPIPTTELFLVAMAVIFALPYLVWRLCRTDYWAPLVVVQICTGVLLGPGVLGSAWPEAYATVFSPPVVMALNGLAWWAVMLFVWLAGVELDLGEAWAHRRESAITAGLALTAPLATGCLVAVVLLSVGGWIGPAAQPWQFVLGIGMSCAVTALPILMLLMDKLQILRGALGQRILRYASLDDLAIWAVLALILMDWTRIGRQVVFLLVFAAVAWGVRRLMRVVNEPDRWYLGLVWLAVVSLGADWCGLHFMLGAFLAGVVLDVHWFGQEELDRLRHHVLLMLMPVYFLSTGLRTDWAPGGVAVLLAAAGLLVAAVGGKLAGVMAAGRWLRWPPGEAVVIGWLLQTKALIMIIFASVLLDRRLIVPETFTALLLMAIASTMLTVPMVMHRLKRLFRPVATPVE